MSLTSLGYPYTKSNISVTKDTHQTGYQVQNQNKTGFAQVIFAPGSRDVNSIPTGTMTINHIDMVTGTLTEIPTDWLVLSEWKVIIADDYLYIGGYVGPYFGRLNLVTLAWTSYGKATLAAGNMHTLYSLNYWESADRSQRYIFGGGAGGNAQAFRFDTQTGTFIWTALLQGLSGINISGSIYVREIAGNDRYIYCLLNVSPYYVIAWDTQAAPGSELTILGQWETSVTTMWLEQTATNVYAVERIPGTPTWQHIYHKITGATIAVDNTVSYPNNQPVKKLFNATHNINGVNGNTWNVFLYDRTFDIFYYRTYNGTTWSSVQLNPYQQHSRVNKLVSVQGKLYGVGDTYGDVFSYNGTTFTKLFNPAGMEIFDMKVIAGKIYFSGYSAGSGLLMYDPTKPVTFKLADPTVVAPAITSPLSNPRLLARASDYGTAFDMDTGFAIVPIGNYIFVIGDRIRNDKGIAIMRVDMSTDSFVTTGIETPFNAWNYAGATTDGTYLYISTNPFANNIYGLPLSEPKILRVDPETMTIIDEFIPYAKPQDGGYGEIHIIGGFMYGFVFEGFNVGGGNTNHSRTKLWKWNLSTGTKVYETSLTDRVKRSDILYGNDNDAYFIVTYQVLAQHNLMKINLTDGTTSVVHAVSLLGESMQVGRFNEKLVFGELEMFSVDGYQLLGEITNYSSPSLPGEATVNGIPYEQRVRFAFNSLVNPLNFRIKYKTAGSNNSYNILTSTDIPLETANIAPGNYEGIIEVQCDPETVSSGVPISFTVPSIAP